MKSIVAIIRQEKYQDVKNELTAVGCQGMNVSEIKGRGSQKGIKESYRGSSYCIDYQLSKKVQKQATLVMVKSSFIQLTM